MFLLSAFLMGLFGSFHCAGMCGPIALALPRQDTGSLPAWASRLLYNAGRIVTYASLGLLAGLVGHSLALAGFQKALSVGSGVAILVVAVYSLYSGRAAIRSGWLVHYTGALKKSFRQLFGRSSPSTFFLIGIVNGLLPCGFVYLALAASVSSGHVSGSITYMVLFGLGTLPMMLFLSLAGNFFGLKFNRFVSKATPYVAVAVALLLISRGLAPGHEACCHA